MSTVRYPMDSHAVLRAYDRWAHVYDMSFALFIRPYHKRVINAVNQGRGAVLDVGVGTGAMLPYYKDHLEITGIDLSPAMLERAHRRVEKHDLDHVKELLVMDATKMDFPDAHFESVVAAFVMTVVPDPKEVLAELVRVCKPGGEVFILNHFGHDKGLRWLVERMIAPLSASLGWHPDMPIEVITENAKSNDLEFVSRREFRPFGIFTMLRFRKPA